jgi:deoxyribodipyrimidine photo-lyase
MSKEKIVVFWFRRDLRSHDNTGLSNALNSGFKVLPIFIFDSEILDSLPKNDARLSFIHKNIQQLNSQFRKESQSGIYSFYKSVLESFDQITQTYELQGVYVNEDYEPYAISRDKQVAALLNDKGVSFFSFKDQVIFEKNDITKDDGKPYVVYTPFKNKWLSLFNVTHPTGFDILGIPLENLLAFNKPLHSLLEMGFEESSLSVSAFKVTPALIEDYQEKRDFPGIEDATSKLGPHLRFGTVSVREIVTKARAQNNQVFLSELIWREFFMQILWHFPHTITQSFKPAYDGISWRNNLAEFEKWKNGITGYPLVDAGMRELNQSGTMHNRVRMLVASFLCKHLLIDWRWGEAYFAEKLLDFELASNVGNWQWAAGSGVDAAPYFRIFNPMTQIDKFDKQHSYIDKWVKDLQELSYPGPMVDHKIARERCLITYKTALS